MYDDPDSWWGGLAQERKRSIMRWLNPGHGTRDPGPGDVPFPDLPPDLAALRDGTEEQPTLDVEVPDGAR